MSNYIDGFAFPIKRIHLNEYKKVAEEIAEIWREFGALAYFEYIGDVLSLEGTRSFIEAVAVQPDEDIIFGWVAFPSKEVRDLAHIKVTEDQRMADLVAPLFHPEKLIFDARRMVYGGFKPLIHIED